jgi:hypothetical protein
VIADAFKRDEHDTRIQQKCTSTQMAKVVRRNMQATEDDLEPEHKLILAVIDQAIFDLKDKHECKSARNFFNGELFGSYCELIGLEPGPTLQLLMTGGFIEPTQPTFNELEAA